MNQYGLFTNEDELLCICYSDCEENAALIFMSNDDRLTINDIKNSCYINEVSVGVILQEESAKLLVEYLHFSNEPVSLELTFENNENKSKE